MSSVVSPRSTHPSGEWIEAAEECYDEISTVIHKLNTEVSLFQATATVIEDGEGCSLPHPRSSLRCLITHGSRVSGESRFENLTAEQRNVATAFKLEFCLNGIHLPEAKRQKALTDSSHSIAYG